MNPIPKLLRKTPRKRKNNLLAVFGYSTSKLLLFGVVKSGRLWVVGLFF